MTRSVLDTSDTEGDFALGMGIAIGMFIALFAVAIALFVIQQGTAYSATQVKEPRKATTTAVLRDAPPAATPTSAPR